MTHAQSNLYTAAAQPEQSQTAIPAIWWRWLLVVCDLNILFGALLAFAPQVYQDILGNIFYDSLLGSDSYATLTALERQYQNWLHGVLGSVLIGWSFLIAWITWYGFRRGKSWAWTAITVSLAAWFIPDMIISIQHEVYLNVIVNIGYIVAFGVPLLATRQYFITKA